MGVPRWAIDAPELPMGSECIYASYWELDSCRAIGWGSGPIPWSALHDYCLAHEIDGADRDEFEYLIRCMDHAHLKYNQSQAAKE